MNCVHYESKHIFSQVSLTGLLYCG